MNCSQIFCTFAVETTILFKWCDAWLLWIALKFFVLLQSKQRVPCNLLTFWVVNCSQIFCTFAVETTLWGVLLIDSCCELLSNFLYFCSRNNTKYSRPPFWWVVNCSQIFCTFAVETTKLPPTCWARVLWIALKFFVLLQSKQPNKMSYALKLSCELLSNFLYFCSRNNFPNGMKG